jgi:pimeloyl-ACP methyl ester carboxylesterase
MNTGLLPTSLFLQAGKDLMQRFVYDGCPIAYRVEGEGPPVVMIQGVGVMGCAWRPQVEALRENFRILTFDNRGIGESRPASRRLTIGQMADDMVALMNHVGWDSAHVIGHSMGGTIAIEAALKAPERVRSLALLCSVARGRDATRMTMQLAWIGMRLNLGSRRVRRRAFMEMVASGAVLSGDVDSTARKLESVFGHDLADRPPVTMRQVAALARYDATENLHRLGGKPVLVVSAADDMVAPSGSVRAMAEAIPGAVFIELADAAHGVTVLEPGVVNDALLRHLDAAEKSLEAPEEHQSPAE